MKDWGTEFRKKVWAQGRVTLSGKPYGKDLGTNSSGNVTDLTERLDTIEMKLNSILKLMWDVSGII